jgi:hypothetical protein
MLIPIPTPVPPRFGDPKQVPIGDPPDSYHPKPTPPPQAQLVRAPKQRSGIPTQRP